MKLSEALRAGAARRPGAPMAFFSYNGYTEDDLPIICSCALGAIAEGLEPTLIDDEQVIFGNAPLPRLHVLDDLIKERAGIDIMDPHNHPLILEHASRPELCFAYPATVSLYDVIIGMYDTLKMSRHEIADVLERAGL